MAGNIYKGRVNRTPLTVKRCAAPPVGCGLRQAIKHFTKRASSNDGYRGQCRRCVRRRGKAASDRATHMMRAYGINPAQFDLLMQKQGGCCAICGGVNSSGMRLAIDHDHKTNKVRGLLCNNCNRALGKFDDDVERLRAAIKYLRESR
jgi:hypothetical protein